MSIFKPSTRAMLQSYRDYRVRRKAVQTLAAMDAAALKDVGINLRLGDL
jgi:uncharacterized protein YjiS (DUF1127 family)